MWWGEQRDHKIYLGRRVRWALKDKPEIGHAGVGKSEALSANEVMRAAGRSPSSSTGGVVLGWKNNVRWVFSSPPTPVFSFGAFQRSPTSPLGIYYFYNLKNLHVLKKRPLSPLHSGWRSRQTQAHPLSPSSLARLPAGERLSPGKGAHPCGGFCLWEPGSEQGFWQGRSGPWLANLAGAGRHVGRCRGRTCPARRGSRRLRGPTSSLLYFPLPPASCLPPPASPCVYVETKMAATVTALPVRLSTVRQWARRLVPLWAEGALGPALLPGTAELAVPPLSESTFPFYPRPSLCSPSLFCRGHGGRRETEEIGSRQS